jgi:hypothetical protein
MLQPLSPRLLLRNRNWLDGVKVITYFLLPSCPAGLRAFFPLQVDDELEIKAYYAGHVLGAAMFQIKVGSESVVYTVSGSIWFE